MFFANPPPNTLSLTLDDTTTSTEVLDEEGFDRDVSEDVEFGTYEDQPHA